MKPISVALVLVVALWAAPRLHATVLISADLPELVSGARAILHGRVVATEPRLVTGRRAIETVVTVDVDEYLKGDFGPRVSVRVPGGQIGFRRSVVIGAPVFNAGDNVVLFLDVRGAELPWIMGLNQGVYRVRADAGTPRRARLMEELQVFEDQTSRASGSAAVLPLHVFKARVRALVRGGSR
jgi:hypothetical protein